MSTTMRSRRIRALLLLNAGLLFVLAAVTFGPSADAQARARGDYVMAASRAPGTNAGVVYIVDAVNQEMTVVTFNQNTKQLEGVAYRDLAADAAEAVRGMPHPGR